jgi:outer membrane biosynthesis protein TonB
VSIEEPAAPFVPAPPVAAALPAARPPPASSPPPPPPRNAEPPRNPAPPASPEPARPPQREPVRLRYWLLALGVLWLIWITQRPSTTLIDARIDGAVALAQACKSSEAQAELIALRSSKATPAQLQRLQSALNDADAACNRRNGRARQAPRTARPPSSGQAQSARNLIADARQAMAAGAYKAASEKMEVCAAMVDAGNRECSALKSRAERLQGEMERCLASGREWVGDRCQ